MRKFQGLNTWKPPKLQSVKASFTMNSGCMGVDQSVLTKLCSPTFTQGVAHVRLMTYGQSTFSSTVSQFCRVQCLPVVKTEFVLVNEKFRCRHFLKKLSGILIFLHEMFKFWESACIRLIAIKL